MLDPTNSAAAPGQWHAAAIEPATGTVAEAMDDLRMSFNFLVKAVRRVVSHLCSFARGADASLPE